MSSDVILSNCISKMKKAFDVFTQDLSSLRTGRANIHMLDIIKVDVYGQSMAINQLANISTPEPRLLTVQVWDQNNVALIDSAIRKSNLGINPQIDGSLMRIPIPSLNEERRTELKKIMGGLAEKAKVSIRNVRREANDKLKKDLKDKKIGEDENKNSEETEYLKDASEITIIISSIPASQASSTTYCIDAVSTTGSNSFGMALVIGENRVPRPAAGITAFSILDIHTPIRQ